MVESSETQILELGCEILSELNRLLPISANVHEVSVKLLAAISLADESDCLAEAVTAVLALVGEYNDTADWFERQISMRNIDMSGYDFSGKPLDRENVDSPFNLKEGDEYSEDNTRGSPFADPEQRCEQAVLYPVWYGTNRQPVDVADISKGFTGDRAKGFGKVYQGRCDVKVPDNHQFGNAGRAFWKRWACFDFNDDHLRIEKITASDSEDSFWEELQERFAENDDSDKDALVFLHGYNNSFEDAVIRAAQIGVDLKVRGYTGLFSWPSKAKAYKYATDEGSIIASENAIADFLLNFIRRSGAERVNIIAHSMGNRGLLAALEKITAKVALENDAVKFGEIILAAADLDAEVFMQAKDVYTSLSRSTTIYSSSTDLPVIASKHLHEYPRLGLVPPVVTVDGVDTIRVKNFSFANLGHGFIAEAKGVLSDVYSLLNHGESPQNRLRLVQKKTGNGGVYWLLDDSH